MPSSDLRICMRHVKLSCHGTATVPGSACPVADYRITAFPLPQELQRLQHGMPQTRITLTSENDININFILSWSAGLPYFPSAVPMLFLALFACVMGDLHCTLATSHFEQAFVTQVLWPLVMSSVCGCSFSSSRRPCDGKPQRKGNDEFQNWPPAGNLQEVVLGLGPASSNALDALWDHKVEILVTFRKEKAKLLESHWGNVCIKQEFATPGL